MCKILVLEGGVSYNTAIIKERNSMANGEDLLISGVEGSWLDFSEDAPALRQEETLGATEDTVGRRLGAVALDRRERVEHALDAFEVDPGVPSAAWNSAKI